MSSRDGWQLAKSNLVDRIVLRLRAQETVLEGLQKQFPANDALKGSLATIRAAIHEAERCGW